MENTRRAPSHAHITGKRMKILYDHQIFTRQNYGGISRYFCELMDQFSRDPAMDISLALRASFNENLLGRSSLDRIWTNKSPLVSGIRVIPAIQKTLHVNLLKRLHINHSESVQRLKTQAFDIFHPTDYNPYFLKYLQKKPFVVTVHDMIHERFPEYYSPGDPTVKWKKEVIEKAASIIAISEHTRKDIQKFTDAEPDRITVIYHGNPFECKGQVDRKPDDSDPLPGGKPYLLFVGTRSRYKNFIFFISAIAGLMKRDTNLQICCAGGGPFSADEKKTLRDLGISSRVFVVSADDRSMPLLYSGARAFVFPSLYEGFGLPLLEAFSCRCPVIASNSGSLPEIGDDAAEYFDPRNPASLLHAVETILMDENRRGEIIKNGVKRARDFSWMKTARQTKTIYKELLDENS